MKKMMSVLMVLVLVLSASVGVFASPDKHSQNGKNSGYVDISDGQAMVSEVLTFQQLVEVLAQDKKISVMEAAKEIMNSYGQTQETTEFNSTSANKTDDMSVTAATFRTISSTVTVNSVYKPTLRFYCETSEGGYFWGIVKILNVGMNREYNGITKQFGGTVYSNLENAGRIFWIVNGDFYNNGTTTVNGGVEIGIGESATVNFGISYSSNHYEYHYEEGAVNIY